jgi:hypothetical protein
MLNKRKGGTPIKNNVDFWSLKLMILPVTSHHHKASCVTHSWCRSSPHSLTALFPSSPPFFLTNHRQWRRHFRFLSTSISLQLRLRVCWYWLSCRSKKIAPYGGRDTVNIQRTFELSQRCSWHATYFLIFPRGSLLLLSSVGSAVGVCRRQHDIAWKWRG